MAWAGGLGGFLLAPWLVLSALGAAAAALALRRRQGRSVVVGMAWLVAAAAVASSAMLRTDGVSASRVAFLAQERAFVTAVVRLTSDPVLREGARAPYVVARGTTREVTGRGRTWDGRVPVLVIADDSWADAELGAVVRVEGRTAPPEGDDLAAVISTDRPVEVLRRPGHALDAAAAVRAGIRRAVAGAGEAERSLVPALVVGDDRGMPQQLRTDFEASGLTHLLAVSGTNLTLVVGFLLVLARWVGVRARGLVVVGVIGVAGFVLLARTEPSVVRAATMGSVALIGMGSNGRQRGVRALGVAVLVLLLADPNLAMSVGFVLSALATAGILFLAPPWRDALTRWLPRWVAEAVAVPLAAQLVCTPVVAAISDQVSLVAVVANMVAAPAVGPATVLGLAGGLLVLVTEPVGGLVGRGGAWCAWWITVVAERSAGLPTAAVEWPASWLSIATLTGVCLALAWSMASVLGRRRWALAAAGVLAAAVVIPAPTPGWPPRGWVMVACDVGQGDALALNAGGGRVVVVDVGPEPRAVDRCLDDLGADAVPVAVLTHFHDDHVSGLPALVGRRRPEELVVSPLAAPAAGAAAVASWARAAGVPVRVAAVGEVRRLGPLTWQVIGPPDRFATGDTPTEGSPANNASVVLLVEAQGTLLLLTGDMEPEAQQAMAESLPSLGVDVLKVPHHGSRHQDAGFLTGLGARLAVVSVGQENTYHHPSSETLRLLEQAGALVRRTDESGDVAVLVREGQLSVRVRRSAS